MTEKRTSSKKKVRELVKYLRVERPDYAYLKSVLHHLRAELEIDVPKASKKLSYVPTEEKLKRYYEVVWQSKNFQDMMIVKTLTYNGIRVSELINVRLTDIDFYTCQIRINHARGGRSHCALPPLKNPSRCMPTPTTPVVGIHGFVSTRLHLSRIFIAVGHSTREVQTTAGSRRAACIPAPSRQFLP